MSARITIEAKIKCKGALVEALSKIDKVSKYIEAKTRIDFTLKNDVGRHAFINKNENWDLSYEDYDRVGNGEKKGKEFLKLLMPIYNKILKEKYPEELKNFLKKQEQEITAKAKALNYRVIRKEEQGKIKLVLIRAGK